MVCAGGDAKVARVPCGRNAGTDSGTVGAVRNGFVECADRGRTTGSVSRLEKPQYAKSSFPQVRTFVALGLPICLADSGLTRRILADLAADTNETVAAIAAIQVRK